MLRRCTPPAVALVKKLIAVLESIEKLPVFSYDTQSSGYGLQVCSKIMQPEVPVAYG